MRRRLSLAVVCGAAAASVTVGAGGVAHAADVDTVVNGVLSVIGGCRTDILPLIQACTAHEALTAQPPVQLELVPERTAIVVLGAGLTPDGAIRPVLESRLQAALGLAERFPQAPVVVSGGAPQAGITEAEAMNGWLVDHGVPAERITLEDRSGSTVGNAANTDRILADRDLLGAVVVTSRDHLERALVTFRDAVHGRIPVTGVVAD